MSLHSALSLTIYYSTFFLMPLFFVSKNPRLRYDSAMEGAYIVKIMVITAVIVAVALYEFMYR